MDPLGSDHKHQRTQLAAQARLVLDTHHGTAGLGWLGSRRSHGPGNDQCPDRTERSSRAETYFDRMLPARIPERTLCCGATGGSPVR